MKDNSDKDSIGLDIGSSHIKAVVARPSRLPMLVRYASSPSKDISLKLMSESSEDEDDVVKFLKDFLKENSISANKVHAVLPEYRIFSKVITMPLLKGKEFESAIKWEAEQHLPQPIDDVYLKYFVLKEFRTEPTKVHAKGISESINEITASSAEKTLGTMEILLSAAPKNMVERYVKILNKVGLSVGTLEPSSLATIRSTIKPDSNIPTIMLNFGYSNIDFYYVTDNKPRFVRTINFGIESLVRAISQELDVSMIQANEYLYTYGLKKDALNGKIVEIIKPVFDIIVEELRRSMRYVESKSSQTKVKRIIVAGGGALIPDMMIYLVEIMSLEIQYANPWNSIDISNVDHKERLADFGPLFASAVGAAINL